MVRTDCAGASRKFPWHLHSLGVQFSTSYTLPFGKAHMILKTAFSSRDHVAGADRAWQAVSLLAHLQRAFSGAG